MIFLMRGVLFVFFFLCFVFIHNVLLWALPEDLVLFGAMVIAILWAVDTHDRMMWLIAYALFIVLFFDAKSMLLFLGIVSALYLFLERNVFHAEQSLRSMHVSFVLLANVVLAVAYQSVANLYHDALSVGTLISMLLVTSIAFLIAVPLLRAEQMVAQRMTQWNTKKHI